MNVNADQRDLISRLITEITENLSVITDIIEACDDEEGVKE